MQLPSYYATSFVDIIGVLFGTLVALVTSMINMLTGKQEATMKTMTNYGKLKREIREYDSNTFFAKGAGITEKEIEWLAQELIAIWSNNYLDGYTLVALLSEFRRQKNGTR